MGILVCADAAKSHMQYGLAVECLDSYKGSFTEVASNLQSSTERGAKAY